MLLALAAACGDQSFRPPPPRDPADLYWSLQLSHHAVALATTRPYDTLPLVATPRNYQDEPLDGLPTAQYVSSDPERVIVGADGVLRAVAPTSGPVAVVATMLAGNLKHVDTVMVSVAATTAPPVLASFSIHPIPPDSAKTASMVSNTGDAWFDTLPARATTPGGEPIPVYSRDDGGYLPVYIRSLDTAIAKVDGAGVLRGIRTGSVKIYASTNAFGVSKVDTLLYRVGAPVFVFNFIHFINLGGSLGKIQNPASNITLGTGGVIIWGADVVHGVDSTDITFDDADLPKVAAAQAALDHLGKGSFCFIASCSDGGNLLLTAFPFVAYSARSFPTPGTYVWRSLRKGITGRVVVVDER